MQLIWVLLILTQPLQSDREKFISRIHESSDGSSLPYRMFEPSPPLKSEAYPLILFLHGSGERGSDNQKQLIHCSKEILTFSKIQSRDLYYLAPQCPEGQRWVDVDWSQPSMTMPQESSSPMKLVVELLKKTIAENPIDPNRIYICGLSMGGFGVWDLVMRHPNLFAAALPICGGGDPNGATIIKHIPVWAFHGGKDQTVPPQLTRNMVEALKCVNGNIRYTEYPTATHNSWTRTFENPEVWEWLLSQEKMD